jgi:hypothetical protein
VAHVKAAAVSAKRMRHLLTREGTPGIEVELVPGADAAVSIRTALAAAHGPVESATVARAAELATAVLTESGLLLADEGSVGLRAWIKRRLVRIEFSSRTPRARWSALDIVASRSSRWGFIEGGQILWFEVE